MRPAVSRSAWRAGERGESARVPRVRAEIKCRPWFNACEPSAVSAALVERKCPSHVMVGESRANEC